MILGPLAYPLAVTIGALAVTAAWAPFADPDELSALAAVAVIVLLYTAFQLALAFGRVPGLRPPELGSATRLRQQHRLVSRSWLEIGTPAGTRWLPVHYEPALRTFTGGAFTARPGVATAGGLRVYPSGRPRSTEPPGRLHDNPTRADPHPPAAPMPRTRLLLDAQQAVGAPLAGLLWVYVENGDVAAFAAATTVAAAAFTWLAAIRGSDPS
ncbi:hypothetical protein ACWEVD_17530 [Nocardia thailandica]